MLENRLNLRAAIEPGKSAAGFGLGENIDSIRPTLGPVQEWKRGGASGLGEAIRSAPGWLYVSNAQISLEDDPGAVLHYGNGKVELHFDGTGMLFRIDLFDGYAGRLWGEVGIGSPLSLAQNRADFFYDDGDEMYYPPENGAVAGVAFLVDEGTEPVIVGISVYDWGSGRAAERI